MVRIVIGGIVGGIVMFAWGAFAHMATPIGGMGLSTIPEAREADVVAAMKAAISEPGIYVIPGGDMSGSATPEQQAAWESRYEQGPTGFLVYHPTGTAPMSTGQLGLELLTNILASLVAALLLSRIAGGLFPRASAVGLMGLFSWISISASHWNWYRFSSDFTLGEGIEQMVGAFLAGLAIAAVVKTPAR